LTSHRPDLIDRLGPARIAIGHRHRQRCALIFRRLISQLSDEPVTQRMLRRDVARMLRVVVEGMTQLRDGPREHARRDVAMTPDAVKEFVTANQLSRALQEHQKHGKSLGLDRLQLAVAPERMRDGVHDDATEAVSLACLSAIACGTG
jgi:hypothetical protein